MSDPNWAEQVTRRLVAQFETKQELHAAFLRFIDANAPEAYVLDRELNYFEQIGALEQVGAMNFDLLRLLLGRRLIGRWESGNPRSMRCRATIRCSGSW